MSIVGTAIQGSLVQAAAAQQTAGQVRDRTRAQSERARRAQDTFELRVASVESTEAARPASSSRESGQESGRRRSKPSTSQVVHGLEAPSVDVKA
jgi:hypothetical protein